MNFNLFLMKIEKVQLQWQKGYDGQYDGQK